MCIFCSTELHRNLVFSNLGRKSSVQIDVHVRSGVTWVSRPSSRKQNLNFWSLTLKAGLPWSWTFGPSACEGKEEHLWTCVLYLPRKVCLSRSSSLQVRTEAEDRWVFGNHRQKSQLNCCCGLTPGVINQLLALCWDLVGVTHMGWCLSKEKSTSGNGQWYVKKVGLYRSCPCFPGLAQEKGKFF